MKTLNQQQALDRVERYIADAISVFPPSRRLEPQHFDDGRCLDPSDRIGDPTYNGRSDGRIEVTRNYWVRDVPKEQNAQYFEALHQYWVTHGFRVTFDNRSFDLALYVENTSDGFLMSARTSVQGDINIGATSPCIWPNGSPPPSS